MGRCCGLVASNCHAAIARALVDQFPEQRESQPELVAHHFTEAGQAEEAVGFWLQAGRRSAQRSAHREAASQLQRGWICS